MIKKTILVTGGLGFIGSNFIHYCLTSNPDYAIVNIDSMTDAANLDNLTAVEMNPRYTYHHIDIRDADAVKHIFRQYQITDVVHFAAETRFSQIAHPMDLFHETNVKGTHNLLEAARDLWQEGPFQPKEGFADSRFHHISTVAVYGSLEKEGKFTEQSELAPTHLFSRSKANADRLVQEYYEEYGLNVVTTASSNNYGPLQQEEKFIPTLVRKALSHEEIPVHGNGQNTRDWLFVLDHCAAIDRVFHQGRKGERYLIGGNTEKSNIEVAHAVCNYLDELVPRPYSYNCMIRFVDDPYLRHNRYAVDATKLKQELGFTPIQPFDTGLWSTIDWYAEKYRRYDVLRMMG
ncbi:dTDP-glucose 4,6-dehydratase [Planococcus salinus]|nr:GDP-mannose 4,6-dehydratase [Planococcus salinus]